MTGHDPIVYGPVAEGELSISGQPYLMSGYGWACSCHKGAHGYPTETEAEDGVTRHLAADPTPEPETP